MDHEKDEKRKKLVLVSNMKTAERKREAILQRQVRRSARAVQKAREVAQRHSKKVTEETERKRMELENRIYETSKRRHILLNNGGRGKVKVPDDISMDTEDDVSNVESMDLDAPRMSSNQAALLIQKWYRQRKFIPLIVAFQKEAASLSVAVAKELPFQDVCALLQSPAVIKATKDLLTQVFKTKTKAERFVDHSNDPRKKSKFSETSSSGVTTKCVQRNSSSIDQRYKTPARIFLSAYMIAAHTDSILMDVHKEIMEKRLLVTALAFLQTFEDWTRIMMEERAQGFSPVSSSAIECFEDNSIRYSNAKGISSSTPNLQYSPAPSVPVSPTKRKSFHEDIPLPPRSVTGTQRSPSCQALNNFLQAWHTYHHSFMLWKQRDTTKLLKTMTEHFLELDALWDTIRNSARSASPVPNAGANSAGGNPHPAVEGEWKPRIMKQRAEIRERVLRIGGVAALERMLAEQREARVRRKEEANMDVDVTGENTDHPEETETNTRSGSVPLFDINRDTQEFSDSVHMASMALRFSHGPSSDMIPASAADIYREGTKHDPLMATSVAASLMELSVTSPIKESFPSSVPSEHKSTPSDSTISNEALAHELIMDPDFTLKPRQRTAAEAAEKEAATNAYFAVVKSDLEKNDLRRWLPGLVADVRERILDLTPESSPIRRQVQEGLDTELINQQVQRNSLELPKLLTFFTETMKQLCAPVRDEAIRNLSFEFNPSLAPEERIRGILDTLDAMRLDLANYRLQALRPHLKLLAVEYESTKFKEALETGKFTLENTTTWLTEAASALQKVKKDRDPEGISHPDALVRYEHVYTDALLGLLIGSGPASRSPPTSSDGNLTPAQANLQARLERYSTDRLPEALLLDRDRIITYSNEAHVLTLVAALVTMSRNLHSELRSLDSRTSKSLRSALLVLLHDDLTVSVESLTIQVISVLQNSSTSETSTPNRVPEETRQLVRSLVEKLLGGRDPVYTLIARRLENALRYFMLNSGNMMSAAALARAGLSPIENELRGLARKIYALARHNREVHAKWYDDIIRPLLE